jgi:hypothetical protein
MSARNNRPTCRQSGGIKIEEILINVAMIVSSAHSGFVRQCRSNAEHCPDEIKQKTTSTKSYEDEHVRKVESWQKLDKIHLIAKTIYYVAVIFKYSLIQLISPGWVLDQYQHLDCFLLGRLKFIGRADKISSQLMLLLAVGFLTLRLMLVIRKPEFKFYACEFLLNDRDVVASNKELIRTSGSKQMHSEARSSYLRSAPRTRINQSFYLKNRFDPYGDEWILRPNRTLSSWLTLNRVLRWATACSLASVIVWACSFFYMIAGSILTNIGFELSYPTCTNWLRRKQTNGSHEYSYIYVAPMVLASELKIDDVPFRIPVSFSDLQPISPYKILRLSMDYFENLFFAAEFAMNLVVSAIFLTLNAADIATNANALKTQLVDIIAQLDRLERNNPPRRYFSHSTVTEFARIDRRNLGQQPQSTGRLIVELDRAQATLVDHFEMTMAYNKFAAAFYMSIFILWLCYTIMVCIWLSTIKNRIVETEFVIIQSISTIYAVVLISISTIIKSRNVQLYPLIARISAKYTIDPEIQLRWNSLMNFFFPRSLYCMTLFNSSEISWLFNLKVSRANVLHAFVSA